MTTSGDDSTGDKPNKAKVLAKGKPINKPNKKPNKKAEGQKTKTIQMLKEQVKAMAEENHIKTDMENPIKTHQMEITTLTKTDPSTRLETKAQPKPEFEPEQEPAKPEVTEHNPHRPPEPVPRLEPDESTTQP